MYVSVFVEQCYPSPDLLSTLQLPPSTGAGSKPGAAGCASSSGSQSPWISFAWAMTDSWRGSGERVDWFQRNFLSPRMHLSALRVFACCICDRDGGYRQGLIASTAMMKYTGIPGSDGMQDVTQYCNTFQLDWSPNRSLCLFPFQS
jgi:hypothetical protein